MAGSRTSKTTTSGGSTPAATTAKADADAAAAAGDAAASNVTEADGVADQATVDAQRDAEGKADGTTPATGAVLGSEPHGEGTSPAPASVDVAVEQGNEVNPALAPKNDGPDAAQREGLGESVARSVDPALGVTSDAVPVAAPRPSARRSPASGPLAPPDATQGFAPVEQVPHGEDAGPRDDETTTVTPEYVDANGKAVTYDDIFTDDGNTFVIVKARTWRTFTYQNTVETGRVLAFREGKKVPRAAAEQVRVALTSKARGEV